MVCQLASDMVDRGFARLWYGRSWVRTKEYEIVIFGFSTKHTALRRMCKDWLARNHNNVFKMSNMSIFGLLFQ